MPSIRVVDLVGPVCVKPADGLSLCQASARAIDQALHSEQMTVTLDFTGVKFLTSSFLNKAVGCLFSSYPIDFLSQTLRFTGLDEVDDELAQLVIKNATKQAGISEADREVIAKTFLNAFEE